MKIAFVYSLKEELIDELGSLKEMIEILSEENLMEQIRNSENDIKGGRVSDVKSADDFRRLFLDGLWTNTVSIESAE